MFKVIYSAARPQIVGKVKAARCFSDDRPTVRSNKNIPKVVKLQAGKTYHWCSCGESLKQPFCDGSHRNSGFFPIKWVQEKDESKLFCCCKNTLNPPFCDMSHVTKVLGGNMSSMFSSPKTSDAPEDKVIIASRLPYYTKLKEGKTYAWCACGRSSKQPFCDGSHEGTKIKPVMFTAEKTKARWLCGCKQTKEGPFCDQTHLDVEVAGAKDGHVVS